jgi:predicted enzyme related to lactoylglutathione lyase
MAGELPEIPAGSGAHPILMVVLSATDLTAAATFYSRLFGWQAHSMTPEVTAMVPPDGPTLTLRAGLPAGFQGMVPFIRVPDVKAALPRIVEAGGAIERAPWSMPMVGTLARFRDPSGTVYGLMDGAPASAMPRVPMPMGANPRPGVGTVCHLEMYAADGAAAGDFFGTQFGWGSRPTMPQYQAFDPGAGIGGIFQSHTPATPAVAYIYVADVRATLTAIDAAGGRRSGDAMPIPGMGCFGYFKDPSGTSMGLIGP